MKQEPIQDVLHIDTSQLHAYSSGLLQGKSYNRLHTSLTKTLQPFDLSVPEWKLLGQLHEHGKVKLNMLAQLLSYDPPMVTKLAKKLEKKELITRMHDTVDERAIITSITREGSQRIEQLEPVVKKTMAQILQGITRDELATYIKVLITIVNNTTD